MRRNTGSIYTVNVYKKGQEEVAYVWEGQATNLIDAFQQARHSYDPQRWAGTLKALLVRRRDNE